MPFGLFLALATLPSCKSKPADTTSTTSSPPSASAVVAAAVPSTPGAPAEKKHSACALVGDPFSVAKGARSDTGITVARLPDGRLAVGYAVKTTPRVAVLDLDARTATQVDVEAAPLSSEPGSADQGSTTFINRVTPVATVGLKMRVLVDAAVNLADKTKRVRCGFADAAPIFTSTSGVDVAVTCRSFSDGKRTWVVSSSTKTDGAGGKPESRWAVTEAKADAASAETVLGTRAVPDAKQDRYTFDLPASVHVEGAGFVFAGRFNGNIALSRRADDLSAAGDVALSWFGAGSGMPSIVEAERTVTVIAPISGKPDLYGASFPIEEAKMATLTPIKLGDEDAAGDRSSLSIARAGADTLVGFVEASGGKKRARVALLDGALKPRLPTFDFPELDKAAVVKLLALQGGHALLVVEDSAGEVTGATLACGG